MGPNNFIILLIIAVLVIVYFKNPFKRRIKFSQENHRSECGPRCLFMIANYYGLNYSFEQIAHLCKMDREEGTNFFDISQAAEKIGLRALAVSIGYESDNPDIPSLLDIPLPSILYWQGYYFVIIEKVTPNKATIIHPYLGRQTYNKKEFRRYWFQRSDGIQKKEGVVLLLEKNRP